MSGIFKNKKKHGALIEQAGSLHSNSYIKYEYNKIYIFTLYHETKNSPKFTCRAADSVI